MFSVPILIITFNRPNETKELLSVLKKLKPINLFIANDGPRKNNAEDQIKCKTVQNIILNNINWECNFKTYFSSDNNGCKLGVIKAINWFFDNVEEGIILEDDCIPAESFFPFCEIMLDKYRQVNNIKLISGTNHLFDKGEKKCDYYFSKIISIWGWATWKRSWIEYDSDIKNYDKDIFFNEYKKEYANFLHNMIMGIKLNQLDTWDIQLTYTILKNNGLSLVPTKNMIKNIGYTGAHGIKKSKFQDMEIYNLNYNEMIHPHNIKKNIYNDRLSIANIIKFDQLSENKFKNMIRKILIKLKLYNIIILILK